MTSILSNDIPDTDLSGKLLQQLFGANWDNSSLAQSGLIYDLCYTFNTLGLSIGCIAMFYWIWIGVASTSHEGKPLGSRLHTIWTPIRATVGISFLAPVFNGLSVLQVLIFAVVSMSISAANFVCDKAMDWVDLSATELVTSNPNIETNARRLAQVIISNQIVQQHLASLDRWDMPINSKGIYEIIILEDTGQIVFQFTANSNTNIADKDMGYIAICNDGSDLCNARQVAVQEMISDAGKVVPSILGNYFVNDIPDGILDDLVDPYIATMTSAISQHIEREKLRYNVSSFTTNVKNEGWIALGSIYWQSSNFTGALYKDVLNLPLASPYNGNAIPLWMREGTDVRIPVTQWERHLNIEEKIDDEMSIWDIRSVSDATDYIRLHVNKFVDPIVTDLTHSLSDGDVVANLSANGHLILNATESLFTIGLLAKAASSSIENNTSGPQAEESFSDKYFFTSKFTDYLTGLVGSILAATEKIYAVLTGAAVALFGIGMMLAYYLPAIPLIYWIMGCVTWIISVFEALIAAPIWAFGHLLPGRNGGHGVIGATSVNGYYIVTSLFLRPMLMVVALVTTAMLMKVVGLLVEYIFIRYTLEGMLADRVHGPLTVLAVLAILVLILIGAAHQIYGLITVLPDMVLRWVDKVMPSAGERQIVAGAETKFAAATGATIGAVGAISKRIGR